MLSAISGQPAQFVEFALYEGHLLGAGPTLYLAFGGDRISDTIEVLEKHQFDGSSRPGISAQRSGIVLVQAFFKRVSRRPHIETTVRAPEKVDESMHR